MIKKVEEVSSEHPEGLTRTGVHRVLEHELGERWRFFRWLARQFSPTSLTVLGAVITGAGTWVHNLSNKVDTQGVKITVLETEVIPSKDSSKEISDRLGRVEVDIATLKGAVGQFDWTEAQKELGRETLHGRPFNRQQTGKQNGENRRGTN